MDPVGKLLVNSAEGAIAHGDIVACRDRLEIGLLVNCSNSWLEAIVLKADRSRIDLIELCWLVVIRLRQNLAELELCDTHLRSEFLRLVSLVLSNRTEA